MSKPTYLLCDVCGARVEETDRLYAPTGFTPDPAGGSADECGEYLDLCPRHASMALRELMRDPQRLRVNDHEAAKRLVAWVREQARKVGAK